MTKDERALATELAQIKLDLRRLERTAKARNPRAISALGEACERISLAILSLSTQVDETQPA